MGARAFWEGIAVFIISSPKSIFLNASRTVLIVIIIDQLTVDAIMLRLTVQLLVSYIIRGGNFTQRIVHQYTLPKITLRNSLIFPHSGTILPASPVW